MADPATTQSTPAFTISPTFPRVTPPSISIANDATSFAPLLRQPPYLIQRIGNEFLPPESRIHAHDQNEIDKLQHLIERLPRASPD